MSRASSFQMRFSVGTCACGNEDEPLVSSFPLWPRVVGVRRLRSTPVSGLVMGSEHRDTRP